MPDNPLQAQIEAEAKELNDVPKIPLHKFMGSNAFGRCHICGRVCSQHDLQPFDGNRLACTLCHPQRGS